MTPEANPRLGPAQRVALGLVRFYQLALSPFFGGACRFVPSCSVYAADAIREHGAVRGSLLAARRLAKCHPFGGSGLDPVPERQSPRIN
jgi:putative membrane protein insertion efficiency factor